jgi:hypothetical protein
VEETSLSVCTQSRLLAPAAAAVPVRIGSKLHIEKPAESMTVYDLQ